MPCALTSPNDYPDYLKIILKEIELGNDENLKIAACSLQAPITQEGCPIVDENGKIGAFPFCWTYTNDPTLIGDGTFNPLKLTLKDAMNLYWQTKSFEQKISYRDDYQCAGGGAYLEVLYYNNKLQKYNLSPFRNVSEKKYLVYRSAIDLVYSVNTHAFCPNEYDTNTTTDYIGASFFINSANVCGVSTSINQYYTKIGENYFFYPSMLYSNDGYWYTSTNLDRDQYNEPYCYAETCLPSKEEALFTVTINGSINQMKLYFYKPYILTDECVTSSNPIDFTTYALKIKDKLN